jgi:hypothetical protein
MGFISCLLRLIGFLCCLVGIAIGFPAWLQWMQVVLSMGRVNPANVPQFMQNFPETAAPVFTQFGTGAIIFGIGILMILVFR